VGQTLQVMFEMERFPAWADVAALLEARQYAVQLRMIDGELSLPGEAPPEAWRELRVGTAEGMVTLRREAAALQFVIWGNADAAMQQARNALVWAFATRGGGLIETETGRQSAADFARQAELPPALRDSL
jgi:hypothetical protein